MTSSIAVSGMFGSPWISLGVVFLVGIVLTLIVIMFNIDEEGNKKPIKQSKPRKQTFQETLISWIVGFLPLIVLIIILIAVMVALGEQLNLATVDCANCTLI